MPIAIAVDRQRVDGENLIAGRDKSTDQQPTVKLDPDDGVLGFVDVVCDHLVKLGDPLDTVCDAAPCEDRAFLLDDADIVVLLGPVDPDEDQTSPSQLDDNDISLEEIGGVLMDQCS